MEDHFKKFVVLFTILASAADCEDFIFSPTSAHSTATATKAANLLSNNYDLINNEIPSSSNDIRHQNLPSTDLKQFEGVVMDYLDDVMNKKLIKLLPGLYLEMKNETIVEGDRRSNGERITRESEGVGFVKKIEKFLSDRTLKIDLAKSSTGVETGRFFFYKGEINNISLLILK